MLSLLISTDVLDPHCPLDLFPGTPLGSKTRTRLQPSLVRRVERSEDGEGSGAPSWRPRSVAPALRPVTRRQAPNRRVDF